MSNGQRELEKDIPVRGEVIRDFGPQASGEGAGTSLVNLIMSGEIDTVADASGGYDPLRSKIIGREKDGFDVEAYNERAREAVRHNQSRTMLAAGDKVYHKIRKQEFKVVRIEGEELVLKNRDKKVRAHISSVVKL